MSQINREHKVNMFTPAFENASDAKFVMFSGEGESIFTNNPYRMIGGSV